MDVEQARRFALSLPEVTEQPHHDKSSFRVRGKIFATVPPDELHLHIFVDESETRASVADDPSAFAELRWGEKLSGLRVTLARADLGRVAELLEDAWRRKAPKRLVAQLDASQPES